MKLTIEVELAKETGPDCDEAEVFDALEAEWDGISVYPISAESEADDSDYKVTNLRLVTKES